MPYGITDVEKLILNQAGKQFDYPTTFPALCSVDLSMLLCTHMPRISRKLDEAMNAEIKTLLKITTKADPAMVAKHLSTLCSTMDPQKVLAEQMLTPCYRYLNDHANPEVLASLSEVPCIWLSEEKKFCAASQVVFELEHASIAGYLYKGTNCSYIQLIF